MIYGFLVCAWRRAQRLPGSEIAFTENLQNAIATFNDRCLMF